MSMGRFIAGSVWGVLMAFAPMLAAGCARNITSEPALRGDLEAGQVYVIQRPVFFRVAHVCCLWTMPMLARPCEEAVVAAWEAGRKREVWPEDVVGLLAAGTRLRYTRSLLTNNRFWMGSHMGEYEQPFALILDGAHEGREVLIIDLCHPRPVDEAGDVEVQVCDVATDWLAVQQP